MDFLPAGWLVKIDDLTRVDADGPAVPRRLAAAQPLIHAGVSIALGPMELSYKREFSNYRKADVTSKIRVPK